MQSHEIWVEDGQGPPFWAPLSVEPITLEGEAAVLAGFSDIEDRKQAEKTLAEAAAEPADLDALARSGREAELEDWLETAGARQRLGDGARLGRHGSRTPESRRALRDSRVGIVPDSALVAVSQALGAPPGGGDPERRQLGGGVGVGPEVVLVLGPRLPIRAAREPRPTTEPAAEAI